MSGDITIGSGDDVVVMSEAVRTALHGVKSAADELLLQRARLVQLVGESETLPVGILPASVTHAIQSMEAAARLLETAEQRARSIDRAVVESLAGYEATERAAGAVWHGMSEQLAWLAGAGLRMAAAPFILGAIGAAPGAAVGWLIDKSAERHDRGDGNDT